VLGQNPIPYVAGLGALNVVSIRVQPGSGFTLVAFKAVKGGFA
jgi:hypothetical protein